MKENISYLINHILCSHNWTVLNKTVVYSDIGNDYIILILSCDKCGKIKKIKIQ